MQRRDKFAVNFPKSIELWESYVIAGTYDAWSDTGS
jgi:hypothetical protein